jgi:hypothetical protein
MSVPPRSDITGFVLTRARHLNDHAQQLDRIDGVLRLHGSAATLRAQTRNLIAVVRGKLDELEALCRD